MRVVLRYRRLDGTLGVVSCGSGDVAMVDATGRGPITSLDATDLAQAYRKAHS